MRTLPILAVLLLSPVTMSAQDGEQAPLEIYGRILAGEEKLAEAQVLVFKGNEQVGAVTTGKSGKFDLRLGMNGQYSLEFRKEGFAPKRILIDTQLPKFPAGAEVVIAPIGMDLTLMEKAKFDGANTDDLDFPFALIKWSKRDHAFVQDADYTADMQRTSGALLLVAARSDQKR
jgi:hypothetical protein